MAFQLFCSAFLLTPKEALILMPFGVKSSANRHIFHCFDVKTGNALIRYCAIDQMLKAAERYINP